MGSVKNLRNQNQAAIEKNNYMVRGVTDDGKRGTNSHQNNGIYLS